MANTDRGKHSFHVNDTKYVCEDPSTLLIDFLHAPLTNDPPSSISQGTKLACGQGGCGACTVHISDDGVKDWLPVNSCLRPVGLLYDKHVRTIEGLPKLELPPTNKDGAGASSHAGSAQIHAYTNNGGGGSAPVQPLPKSTLDLRQTLAQYGGSQCGFCSPGMIMASYPYLDKNGNVPPPDPKARGDVSPSDPKEHGDVPPSDPKEALLPPDEYNKCNLSPLDIEDLFSGNICRCTGYRSILCGMKTYAENGNADELNNTPPYVLDEKNSYANNLTHPNVTVTKLPPTTPPQGSEPQKPGLYPAALGMDSSHLARHTWTRHHSLEELKRDIEERYRSKHPSDKNYKLVYGNTSYGVYPKFEWANVGWLIDISGIGGKFKSIEPYPPNIYVKPWLPKGKDWDGHDHDITLLPEDHKEVRVSIGAGVTIQGLVDWLQKDHKEKEYRASRTFMMACAQHLKRVAGHQVRNAGSIGGSLMMAKLWNFPSDTWTVLDGAQAAVTLWSPDQGERPMSFEDFQKEKGPIVVVNVILTLWKDGPSQSITGGESSSSAGASKQGSGPQASCFASARVAQRLQNAHPLVNFAAFNYWNSGCGNSFSCVWGNIDECNVPTFDLKDGERWPERANTSHYRLSEKLSSHIWAATLAGWPSDGDTLDSLLDQVEKELLEKAHGNAEEQGDPIVRCRVATNLLRKYCIVNLGASSSSSVEVTDSLRQTIHQARTATASSGSQRFMVNTADEPVSEPFIKASAILQTKGEALYTQSILAPNTVHATFVSSWAAAAKIISINTTNDTRQKLRDHLLDTYGIKVNSDDFHLYTAQDSLIQKFNLLNAAKWIHHKDPPEPKSFHSFPSYLLANVEVVYHGQPVAILVGPSERIVTLAAEYLGTEKSGFLKLELNQMPPILSVQDAIDAKEVEVRLDRNRSRMVSTLFNTVTSDESSCKAINSVSKGPDGPNNLTSIDFSQFGEDQGYWILEGEHSVPAQVHFYMETQSALACPPPSEAGQGKAPAPSPSSTAPSPSTPALPPSSPAPSSSSASSPSTPALPPSGPTPSSMKLYASTQSCMQVRGQVEAMLASLDNEWEVDLITPQVGGGFGGKEVQSIFVALGAAFVASQLHVPCRFVLSRDADMRIIGHRHPMTAKWKVAVHNDTGVIKATQIDYLADAGCTYDATLPVVDLALLTADNAYNIEHFCATGKAYFTNKASNTAMRSFGVVQSLHMTEMVLERIAEKYAQRGISRSPFALRSTNFYVGQEKYTPFGQLLVNPNIDAIWQDMDTMLRGVSQNPIFGEVRHDIDAAAPPDPSNPGYDTLTRSIAAYNRAHTYQKLGHSVLPLKYGIAFTSPGSNMGQCVIQIDTEGNVIVQCPGVEMGQGLDTKMKQIASLKLGIFSDRIRYNPDGVQLKYFEERININEGNTDPTKSEVYDLPATGASTGSDLNGGAIARACDAVKLWLQKTLDLTPEGQVVWTKYVQQQRRWYTPAQDLWSDVVEALKNKFALPYQSQLSDGVYISPGLKVVNTKPNEAHVGNPFYYFNYAAASVLALVDCLTGEEMIVSADIIYDAGISLNPAIDIGQVEGGFVQGLGYNTCEEVTHNEEGKLTSLNTWLYKPPSTLEIPMRFNVHLYPIIMSDTEWEKRDPNDPRSGVRLDSHHRVIDPYGIQSSKTTGEPPLVLSNAVYFAIRNALKSFMGVPQYLDGVDRSKAETPKPASQPIDRPFNPKEDEFKLICPATTFNIMSSIMDPLGMGVQRRQEERRKKRAAACENWRTHPSTSTPGPSHPSSSASSSSAATKVKPAHVKTKNTE